MLFRFPLLIVCMFDPFFKTKIVIWHRERNIFHENIRTYQIDFLLFIMLRKLWPLEEGRVWHLSIKFCLHCWSCGHVWRLAWYPGILLPVVLLVICCWRLAVDLFAREHAVGVTHTVWRLLGLLHSLLWLISTSEDTGLKAERWILASGLVCRNCSLRAGSL